MTAAPPPAPGVVLRAQPFTAPDAQLMLAGADAANAALYGHPDETPYDPTQFDPDRGGLFLVAYLDGEPVGCGGFRRAEPPAPADSAEIKRMYVAEGARRAGVGRAVLTALEDAARTRGYHRTILDTGSKQAPAHRLYESAGYHLIPGFSIYRDRPGNRAYGKPLDSSDYRFE